MNPDPRPGPAARFSTWILEHPRASVSLALVFVLATSAGTAFLNYEYGYRSNYYDDNPLLAELDAFERRFSASEALVLAVHSPEGTFRPETVELLRHLTGEMWKLPDVIRVDSIVNYAWVHADGDEVITEPLLETVSLDPRTLAQRERIALSHELLPGYLISADGRTTLLFAFPRTTEAGVEGVELVRAARALVDSVQGRGTHTFHLSGDPVINNAFQENTEADTAIISPLISIFSVLLLAFFFRRVTGVLLPFMVVGATVGASMGLLGWLGVDLTPISSATPQVLIAICFADSIHLLMSFRLARGEGRTPREAAHHALTKNVVPTLLTTVSTAIGFLSFSTVEHKGLGGFGIGAGLGCLIAWPMTYLLLGPVLPRLNWTGVKPTPTRLVDGVLTLATRFRTGVITAAAVFAAVITALAAQVRIDSNVFEYFKRGTPLRTATEFIEQEVGAAFAIELVVDTKTEDGVKDPDLLRRVDAFESWLRTQDEVAQTVSIVGIVKEVNRALHQGRADAYSIPDDAQTVGQEIFLYQLGVPASLGITDRVTVDYSAMRVTILWSVASAQRARALLEHFTQQAEQRFGLTPEQGATISFTGRYVLFQRQVGLMIQAFLVSVVTAFTLISALLIVYFRSFWLGALALLPNLIPLLVGGAILAVAGKPLDLGTVLLTSICLGIAVDDTVHIMAGFRQHLAEGREPPDAVRAVLTYTAPALFTTTTVLVGTFSCFLFANIVVNVRFGVMSAIILTVALAVDLAFLPALLLSRFGKSAFGPASRPSAPSRLTPPPLHCAQPSRFVESPIESSSGAAGAR